MIYVQSEEYASELLKERLLDAGFDEGQVDEYIDDFCMERCRQTAYCEFLNLEIGWE